MNGVPCHFNCTNFNLNQHFPDTSNTGVHLTSVHRASVRPKVKTTTWYHSFILPEHPPKDLKQLCNLHPVPTGWASKTARPTWPSERLEVRQTFMAEKWGMTPSTIWKWKGLKLTEIVNWSKKIGFDSGPKEFLLHGFVTYNHKKFHIKPEMMIPTRNSLLSGSIWICLAAVWRIKLMIDQPS